MIRTQYFKKSFTGNRRDLEFFIYKTSEGYGFEPGDLEFLDVIEMNDSMDSAETNNRVIVLARFEIKIAGISIKRYEFCINYTEVKVCPELFSPKKRKAEELGYYIDIIAEQNNLFPKNNIRHKLICENIFIDSIKYN